MVFDDVKKEDLFLKGLVEYNSKNFYDAHEYWEELWSDYNMKDAKFIQAFIQLAVGYFHVSNLNRNGAIGLFNKCIPKLKEYSPEYRGINIDNIIRSISLSLDCIEKNEDLSQFDWRIVPKLKK